MEHPIGFLSKRRRGKGSEIERQQGSLLWMAFTRAWTVAVVVAAACAVLVAGSIAVDVFHKKCFFVSDPEREGRGVAGNHGGVTNAKTTNKDWYISGKMIQFINSHT